MFIHLVISILSIFCVICNGLWLCATPEKGTLYICKSLFFRFWKLKKKIFVINLQDYYIRNSNLYVSFDGKYSLQRVLRIGMSFLEVLKFLSWDQRNMTALCCPIKDDTDRYWWFVGLWYLEDDKTHFDAGKTVPHPPRTTT